MKEVMKMKSLLNSYYLITRKKIPTYLKYYLATKSEEGRLPEEYQEVEYLESTGTQYIDTGIVPSNVTGVKLKLSVSDIQAGSFLFGCRETSGNTRFIIGRQYGSVYFGFGIVYGGSQFPIATNVPFEAYLNFNNSRDVHINTTDSTVPLSDISSIEFTYSLIMFGRNNQGSIAGVAQKVYSCQITEGNNLIANFIPCYRKLDNKAGMYDTVTKTFFTNSGTGEFSVGGDV